MAPRLSKRQQRELEELEALSAGITPLDTDSEEDERLPTQGSGGFSALFSATNDGEEDESDSETEKQTSKSKKSKKKPKKKKDASGAPSPAPISQPKSAPDPQPSSPPSAPSPQPQPGPSKKEWKVLKKQKAKEKKEGKGDIDKALEELSLKYQDVPSQSSVGKGKASSTAHEWHTLLAVSIPNLDPDAELRKFFGAKVVSAAKNAPGASSSVRRQPQVERSNLTKPRPGWWPAKMREGLTLRALTEEEVDGKGWLEDAEEKWWTVEYSKRYKGVTLAFMQTVLSGDPEGLYRIVRQVPWHGDTLLQMAEVYNHREEHSTAADFIDRALFTYERAFVGAFSFAAGIHRLDFDRVENRPFFLAIHRQVIDLQRRGVFRTAFEFARLLCGLDPWTDPHGALLHLDFLAIKAGMHQWLLDVTEVLRSKPETSVHHLPGWVYARALALRMKSDPAADDALQQAIRDFPSVVPLLADKAEIALSGEIRGMEAFRIYVKGSGVGSLFGSSSEEEPLLHLLSHLYVQRSAPLWKDPKHSAWFASAVHSAVQSGKLPRKPTTSPAYASFATRARDPSFASAVYRHVLVLGASAQSLLSFLPADALRENSLACDPLPPPSAVSKYDEEFFKGAEEAFGGVGRTRRSAAANQRLLERLVPDPVFRRELQGFFDAHPGLMQQFPGGVVQFAQMAGDMDEEALQEMMMAHMMQEEAEEGGRGMPGGMPGEQMLLHFAGEGEEEEEEERERGEQFWDVHGAGLGVQDGERGVAGEDVDDEENDEDEDEDEEDEDEEEVVAAPVRVLRNLLGRFWPMGSVGREDSSSSDEEDGDLDGRAHARDDDVD